MRRKTEAVKRKCYNYIAVDRVGERKIRDKAHSGVGTINWKGKEPTDRFCAVLPCASRGVLEIKRLFKLLSLRLYFVYGGNWNGSSNNVGSNGNYWSSVVNDDNNAYDLNFNKDGNLNPQNNDNRNNGNSVRCVAR